MTQTNPSIAPPVEDVFASNDTPPMLPDKNQPSLAGAIFDIGVHLRYNLRSQQTELMQMEADAIPSVPTHQWVVITDRAENRLRDVLTRRFTCQSATGPKPMTYSQQQWKLVVGAHLCSREVDPFLEWLNDLPAWDATPRIDNLLRELFNAEDCALTRWVSQYLFLGPVHRTYTPGAKLDEMPVLVGAQNIGKSSLLSNLFPDEHSEWFSDGLNLAADPKLRAEAIQGRVVVEVSEMAGSNKADLDSLKTFMARRDDGTLRLAFRHNPEPSPRRACFIGTTNRLDSLPNDPSGNRRFVPISLHPPSGAIEPYLAIHRDQLWAEALYRHAQGLSPRIPRDLTTLASKAAEKHRNRDTVIEDALDLLPPDWRGTLGETAQKIGLVGVNDATRLSQRDSRRISSAFTGNGWIMRQRRVEGVMRREWQKEAA